MGHLADADLVQPEGRDGVSPARERGWKINKISSRVSGDTAQRDDAHGRSREHSPRLTCGSHLYLLHVVFSTKNRAPLIRNLNLLINNLRGIARNKGIDVLAAGGTQNHIHLLLRLPPVRPVS